MDLARVRLAEMEKKGILPKEKKESPFGKSPPPFQTQKWPD